MNEKPQVKLSKCKSTRIFKFKTSSKLLYKKARLKFMKILAIKKNRLL